MFGIGGRTGKIIATVRGHSDRVSQVVKCLRLEEGLARSLLRSEVTQIG